jgi:hypothetical protein
MVGAAHVRAGVFSGLLRHHQVAGGSRRAATGDQRSRLAPLTTGGVDRCGGDVAPGGCRALLAWGASARRPAHPANRRQAEQDGPGDREPTPLAAELRRFAHRRAELGRPRCLVEPGLSLGSRFRAARSPVSTTETRRRDRSPMLNSEWWRRRSNRASPDTGREGVALPAPGVVAW